MTTIINLYGGPGTGKSTTMAKVFAYMKERGFSVEMAHEWVKLPVWAGETHVLEDQLYILAKHNRALRRLVGNVDYVVTDAPLLMSLVYSNDKTIHEIARACYRSYSNFDVLLKREKEYAQGGRTQNEAQARALDVTNECMLVHEVGETLIDRDWETLGT